MHRRDLRTTTETTNCGENLLEFTNQSHRF